MQNEETLLWPGLGQGQLTQVRTDVDKPYSVWLPSNYSLAWALRSQSLPSPGILATVLNQLKGILYSSVRVSREGGLLRSFGSIIAKRATYPAPHCVCVLKEHR